MDTKSKFIKSCSDFIVRNRIRVGNCCLVAQLAVLPFLARLDYYPSLLEFALWYSPLAAFMVVYYFEGFSMDSEFTGSLVVSINGVEVGKIPSDTFAEIRSDVRSDWRVYVDQVGNLIGCCVRFLLGFLRELPIVLFWSWVFAYFFRPEWFSEVMRAEFPQTYTPDFSGFLSSLLFLVILVVGLKLILGRSFGFSNKFREETGNRVRQFLKVPVKGHMLISRPEQVV